MLSSLQCLLCPCLLWSLLLVCTSTAGPFSGGMCTTWRNFLTAMAVIVGRHDLVSSLSLGLSNGILNPASPGREVYLFVNGIQPPQSRMDWAPFYGYLSRHRSPNGPEHQQELGFTGPFRTCRMAWFPKDKEGFSDLDKQTKHICGYPGNKPSLKLL